MELPILSTVSAAYGFVWRARSAFWVLALPGIVVVAIFGALSSWLIMQSVGDSNSAHRVPMGPEDLSTVSTLASLVGFLVYAAVFVLYSVAWHRVYLLSEERESAAAAYRWGRRQTKFLLQYVKLFLLLIPILLLAAIPSFLLSTALVAVSGDVTDHLFLVTLISQAIMWFGVMWVLARYSMVFPAAAVDHELTFREAWRLTHGNGWRLFWIVVLAMVPFWIVTYPIGFALGLGLAALGLEASLTAMLVYLLIWQFIGFIGIAVGVSVLSICYRALRGVSVLV